MKKNRTIAWLLTLAMLTMAGTALGESLDIVQLSLDFLDEVFHS